MFYFREDAKPPKASDPVKFHCIKPKDGTESACCIPGSAQGTGEMEKLLLVQ